MSFKSDLQRLKKQIELYNNGEKFQQKIEDCKQIEKRLADCQCQLEISVRKQKLVRRLPDHSASELQVPVIDTKALSNVTDSFSAYQGLWKKDGPCSVQDEKNKLNSLIASVNYLYKILEQEHEQAWNSWIKLQKDRFEVLDEVLKNQKLVSNGISVEQDYKQCKMQFEQALGTFNFQEIQLGILTALADQLHTLRGQMNTENLPGSVQHFLASLNTTGKRVTLELLTEEVFFWLKERNLLSKFIVKQS